MNEILATAADAIVGVGFIAPHWVNQVATTGAFILWLGVMAVIVVVLLVVLVATLYDGDFVVALVVAAMLAIVVLVVTLTWSQSMANFRKGIFPETSLPSFSWSPWFYILCGAVGVVFVLFLLIGSTSDSPNVNIDAPPLYVAVIFIISILFTISGIVGLFDYRFVQAARSAYISLSDIQGAAPMIAMLIGNFIFFVASIKTALTGSRVLLWSIIALIAGALFVFQLVVLWSYWG